MYSEYRFYKNGLKNVSAASSIDRNSRIGKCPFVLGRAVRYSERLFQRDSALFGRGVCVCLAVRQDPSTHRRSMRELFL